MRESPVPPFSYARLSTKKQAEPTSAPTLASMRLAPVPIYSDHSAEAIARAADRFKTTPVAHEAVDGCR